MYVHEGRRLIYLAHPRTGSRSVAKAMQALGFVKLGAHHDGPRDQHLPTTNGYTLFTNVRNHWDTLTSWFYQARGQADDPKFTVKWLRSWFASNPSYFRLPRLFWFLEEHPEAVVLRYETLQEDFHNFLDLYNLGETALPHVGLNNWRKGRLYTEVIAPEVREFIAETFADEIAQLGYAFGGE